MCVCVLISEMRLVSSVYKTLLFDYDIHEQCWRHINMRVYGNVYCSVSASRCTAKGSAMMRYRKRLNIIYIYTWHSERAYESRRRDTNRERCIAGYPRVSGADPGHIYRGVRYLG